MSTFKKLLALTLALAMVLSVSAFAGYSKDTYKDAASIDEDCESAIELMYALDIMTGDANGNFNPTATITRAEVAKMIYVILNYGEDDLAVNYKGANVFTDVPAGAWYEGYVTYAYMHKLVNGRGNGTFGPNDPVTTAEAAKMLLTAIGYSAEARGYTGANWAFNVLSDARILGLLDGYNFSTTGYAPRQWVAVMVENALYCYTFDTMRPTFSGLLISGEAETAYDTMGGKYYGLDVYTGVAIATATASVDYYDGDDEDIYFAEADTSWVLFDNGKQYRSTGLGAMDLGQEYRVIYSKATDKTYAGTAYSCKATGTSVVAEARTMDMEVDTKFGTSNNVASNKYVFTVEDMEANFNAASVNALYTGTEKYEDMNGNYQATKFDTLSAKALREMIEDRAEDTYARNNDLYKVIDADGDGDIDYVIVTEFAYANITKVGDHDKYGVYVKATKADGETLKYNRDTELYVDDTIITEDELAKYDYVKFTWDLDEGKFAMEVLPEEIDALYEARDTKAKKYDIGGTEYQVADNGWDDDAYEWLNASKKLGKEVCIAYDGDLIVALWTSSDLYTEMADVNAQLVLVTDVRGYKNTLDQEDRVISYLTIDGELHENVPYQNHEDGVEFADLRDLSIDDTDIDNDYTDEEFTLKGRLFILHEGSKGRVWLEALSEGENEEGDPAVNDQLSASSALLNGYEERDPSELNAKGTTVKLDGDKMVGENPFFYAYIKSSNGEPVFTVITPDEFGKGITAEAYAQVLTFTKESSGRTTVLGGYVAGNLNAKTAQGYLYITEILKETAADGVTVMAVMDGGTEAVKIALDDYEFLMTDVLYSYTYDFIDGDYDLTYIDIYDLEEWVVWYDEEVAEINLTDMGEMDLDDETVAILTIDLYRDDTKYDDDDDADWLFDAIEKNLLSIEFVQDLSTITEEDITDLDTDSYEQVNWTYYDAEAYDEDGMLYVVVIRYMEEAHPERGENAGDIN